MIAAPGGAVNAPSASVPLLDDIDRQLRTIGSGDPCLAFECGRDIPRAPDARVAELMAVTAERVRDAAARIFRAKSSSLVVIGKLDAKARAALQASQRSLDG